MGVCSSAIANEKDGCQDDRGRHADGETDGRTIWGAIEGPNEKIDCADAATEGHANDEAPEGTDGDEREWPRDGG